MNPINTEKYRTGRHSIIGVMTGTSLDGIDLALVEFSFSAGQIAIHKTICDTFDYNDSLRLKAKAMMTSAVSARDFSQMGFALAQMYADAIDGFCKKYKIEKEQVSAVSCHGQTIWHEPMESQFGDYQIASSLQMLSGGALAKLIELPVVYDFRVGDIALGGGGAPLVPIFDYYYFRDYYKNFIALNIGGMANITYVAGEQISAWDTGPGNILIDLAVQKLYDKQYDANGDIAASGQKNEKLFAELLQDEYISQKPPKSTGREKYNWEYLEKFDFEMPKADLICTLTHFTAYSIAENIKQFTKVANVLIASGGGVRNLYLMKLLGDYLSNFEIKTSADFNCDIDGKEAICFAYLGYRTLCGLPSNLPSVTGASKETILGSVAF